MSGRRVYRGDLDVDDRVIARASGRETGQANQDGTAGGPLRDRSSIRCATSTREAGAEIMKEEKSDRSHAVLHSRPGVHELIRAETGR